MEAIASAVKSVVSAITPKASNTKNQVVALENLKNTNKKTNTNANTRVNTNVRTNIITNTNTNMNNNEKVANVRFEPGGRQNVYSSFQSASAEGGRRRKRRHTKKTHRKSKKHMSYRKRH